MLRRFARLALAPSLALAAACGNGASSNDGTATVTGEAFGISLDAHGSFAIFEPGNPSDTLASNTLLVIVPDAPGMCGFLEANGVDANKANLTVLTLVVMTEGPGGAAPGITAGTYAIAPSLVEPTTGAIAEGGASATLAQMDAHCALTLPEADTHASSGTITLTNVTANGASGSFELVFGSSTLSGTFDAPVCSGVAPASGSLVTPASPICAG